MASSSTYLALAKKYRQEQIEYANLIMQINPLLRSVPDISKNADNARILVEEGAIIGRNQIIAHEELKKGKNLLENISIAITELINEVRKAKENSAKLEAAAMKSYQEALAREIASSKEIELEKK